MDDVINLNLKQDIGAGDITSNRVLAAKQKVRAKIIARAGGTVAGLEECSTLFKKYKIKCSAKKRDGQKVKRNDVLLVVHGNARKLLSIERTVLNIIGWMSGIATITKKLCSSGVQVAATRKMPMGNLMLDKKAVVVGGGLSHRWGLWDMTLIKDTHLDCLRLQGMSTEQAILTALKRAHKPREIEVQNLREAIIAAKAGAELIMLDNFSPAQAKKAVTAIHKINHKTAIELSGGISSKNIKKYAKAGADFVSTSQITAEVPFLNVSMKIVT